MNDIVFIEALEIDTVIGVYDWEREIRQRLVLSVEMAWDTSNVAQTDDLELALDYKMVAERLTEVVQQGRFRLLETAAESLAQVLISEFFVSWLKLRLNKPDALQAAAGVGVVIERGERP